MEVEVTQVDVSGIDDKATCNICARIIALCKMPFEVEAEVELGKVSEVLASECSHVDWIRNVKYMYGPVPRYHHREVTARKDKNQTSVYLGVSYSTRATSTWSTTKQYELVAQKSHPDHPGRSRILDPKWMDTVVVRAWYSRCLEEHGLKCNQPPWIKDAEPVAPDWLIDTSQACIVPSNNETKNYVSLSYTWGQTPNLSTRTGNLDKLRRPGAFGPDGDFISLIPETIRNAFELTKLLGERYLWVDSLCIVQDDEEGLYRSLEMMHMIYANSVLCLVAKAGQDAQFGLRGIRGVSGPRLRNQEIIELADGQMLTGALSDTGQLDNESTPSIPGRSYSERAWTFQEFMFAKRRLIFDLGPLRWHCSCAGWHEELNFHAAADAGDAVAPELWYSARWMQTRIPNLSDLTDVVREFNQKILTYPEDVLPAFSGIQSMLHKKYPGGLIYGVPEFFFDVALAWVNIYDVTRRLPSANFKGDASKDNLPSWSWMGWHGNTCFPWDLEFQTTSSDDCGFLEPVTTWFTMDSPASSSRRRIESRWFEHKKSARDISVALPKGWTRNAYEPAKWLKRRDVYRIPQLPRELPQFSYTHSSNPDGKFWYPVPVLEPGNTPELRKQTQYLYCMTHRAFLFAGHGVVQRSHKEHVQIDDKHGDLAGVLYLHRDDDKNLFTANSESVKIELIAIAKGWTKTLKGISRRSSKAPHSELVAAEAAADDDLIIERFKATGIISDEPALSSQNNGLDSSDKTIENIDTIDEGSYEDMKGNDAEAASRAGGEDLGTEASDVEDSEPNSSWWNHLDSEDERPEYWKENREDCYFVLWIKWVNGVAYRQASGCVLAATWEKYKEEDQVELVLG